MKSIISIGNFDGLHLGHRKLLGYLTELAWKRNLRSLVITYDNHPSQILNSHARPLVLLPAARKKEALLALGVGEVAMLHFDERLAMTSADEFLHEYIIPSFDPASIVVGYDSHFGRSRQGNCDFLQAHASSYGYELHYVDPIQIHGRVVSSSLIRDLLLMGDLEEANTLLGRPYTLYGKVRGGSGQGRGLGFPTTNLEAEDSHQLIPRGGIYLSRAHLGGEHFFGLTNIGSGPTLKPGGRIEVETFIFDFDRQIYGSQIAVELLRYLREEKLFASKEALIEAIKQDVARARELLAAGL